MSVVDVHQQSLPQILQSQAHQVLNDTDSYGLWFPTGGVKRAVLVAAILTPGIEEISLQESNGPEGAEIINYEWAIAVGSKTYCRIVADPSCAWIRANAHSGAGNGTVLISLTVS